MAGFPHLAIIALLPACYLGQTDTIDAGAESGVCTQIPLPDGGVVHVTGTVTDVQDGTPIASAMIAVEYGGTYVAWCDLAHASPYYVFGAVTDATGSFSMDVRAGALGFHSFANGYYYSRASLDTSTGTTVALTMGHLPSGQAAPTITNVGFDQPTVTAGSAVVFSATLATWSPTDPLSDENLVVEATRSWGVELDPPSQGQKDNFPDGVWKRSFSAPSQPGVYTYWFSATTAGCITSNLASATLTVN